jgi:ADP-heptose:LPS heptosyltransferase
MISPNKVLTINFGGIGDEILFLPALKSLRAALPAAKITLLLEPRSRSIEQVTDLIDATITFDIKKRPLLPGHLWQLLTLIRQGNYDLVISSGSSPQVAALLFLSGIPVRIGYGSNPLAKLLLTHWVPLSRDQYAGNMYHDLIQGLNNYLQKDKSGHIQSAEDVTDNAGAKMAQIPQILVKEEARAAMQTLIDQKTNSSNNKLNNGDTAGSASVKIVLIHPGTSTMAVQKGIIKHWPSENWLTLIQKLCHTPDLPFKLKVILAGGPDDKEVISALEARLDQSEQGRPDNFQSVAGLTRGLSDLAALLELSDVIVCVDSAPMHLAVGLNKKTVALFGPTEPEKLIPNHAAFKVLADRPSNSGASRSTATATEPPRSLLDGLGVRLQPDIVYQSVLDLLKAE